MKSPLSTSLPLVALLVLLGASSVRAPVHAETIGDVLDRSQQLQLESFELAPPDGRQAQILQQSFNELLKALAMTGQAELHVIVGPTIAETLNGHALVANARLADAPEQVRLFVLAHELGHVSLSHWRQMGLLFQKWVPGEIDARRPIEPQLNERMGRDAARLANQQEFEADAFAGRVVARLRPDSYNPQGVFMYLGAQQDTVTHPGTQRRMAALRWQAELLKQQKP